MGQSVGGDCLGIVSHLNSTRDIAQLIATMISNVE
jgi:hypothetical protein